MSYISGGGGGGGGGGGARILFSADTTFYVSQTGSDTTGDGSVGNPWLTIQHAVNELARLYDYNGFNGFLQLVDSVTHYLTASIPPMTNTAGTVNDPVFLGIPALFIQGNAADHTAVQLDMNPAFNGGFLTGSNPDVAIVVSNVTMNVTITGAAQFVIENVGACFIGDGSGGTVEIVGADPLVDNSGDLFVCGAAGAIGGVSDNLILNRGAWTYGFRAEAGGYIFLSWFSTAAFSFTNSPSFGDFLINGPFTTAFGAMDVVGCTFAGALTSPTVPCTVGAGIINISQTASSDLSTLPKAGKNVQLAPSGTFIDSKSSYMHAGYELISTSATTLANGLNSDIALPASPFMRITGPSAGFSVGGIVIPQIDPISAPGAVSTGATADGIQMKIYNATAQQMTIVNEDASSTAVNRIKTLTGGNVVLRAGTSFATLTYCATDQRWILESTN